LITSTPKIATFSYMDIKIYENKYIKKRAAYGCSQEL